MSLRCLIDSCILIDVLREDEKSIRFVRQLERKPYVSVITVMELFHGARSAAEEHRIERLLGEATVLPVDERVGKHAGAFLRHFHKSHNVDFADALIAATAEHHDLELVTLNVKHFPMFPALQRPY